MNINSTEQDSLFQIEPKKWRRIVEDIVGTIKFGGSFYIEKEALAVHYNVDPDHLHEQIWGSGNFPRKRPFDYKKEAENESQGVRFHFFSNSHIGTFEIGQDFDLLVEPDACDTNLRDRRPTSVGGPITEITGDADILDEMLNG